MGLQTVFCIDPYGLQTFFYTGPNGPKTFISFGQQNMDRKLLCSESFDLELSPLTENYTKYVNSFELKVNLITSSPLS